MIMLVKCKFTTVWVFTRNCRCKSTSSNSLYQLNTNITNYFKTGDIEAAVQLFDEIPRKNIVTWNCMISGYVRNEKIREARQVFDLMPVRNVVSWTAMLTGYAKGGCLDEARRLFDGISSKNVVCWNSMITGYVTSGRMAEARELFDAMPMRNSVTWVTMIEGYFCQGLVTEAEMLFARAPVKSVPIYNAMLSGYAENGDVNSLRKLFMGMPQCDVASWTSVINGLLRAGNLEKARGLFDEMPKRDVVVWTVMIRGYLDNDKIDEACILFNEMPCRDIVAWNSMIGGYVQNGRLEDALNLFMNMPQRDVVSWNSILQGYVQQNEIIRARNFFEEMPRKDETSWNTMISGYQSEEALVLFVLMLQSGLRPDQGTLTSVISACGALAIYSFGIAVHSFVIEMGYENDIFVVSSMISMYSKCGFMSDAALVFERMINKDTVSWNAIIVAQAYHGSHVEALKLYHDMIQAKFKPDHVTFLGVFAACTHSGLVDESMNYFGSMEKDWNLIPKAEHYACIIDLLGRSGLLIEAYELVKQLPVDLPAYTWESLLSSCRVHGNFELGERVKQKISGIQPLHTGMSVLLSNIYAARGMWNDAENIRTSLKHSGLKKEMAWSWIEIKGKICRFVSNDKSHPQMENIKKELVSLSIIIEEFGRLMH